MTDPTVPWPQSFEPGDADVAVQHWACPCGSLKLDVRSSSTAFTMSAQCSVCEAQVEVIPGPEDPPPDGLCVNPRCVLFYNHPGDCWEAA